MTIERTQIKFALSKGGGEIIGFVSRNSKTKKLKGVRENSTYGKKIVVLSEDLKGKISPNLLYEVELKEMHNGNGFVAISAKLVKFPASFETTIEMREAYQIRILFGNKTIYFDPMNGRSPSSRTIQGVVGVLKCRQDIEDIDNVLLEFRAKSQQLVKIMTSHGVPYQSAIDFEP